MATAITNSEGAITVVKDGTTYTFLKSEINDIILKKAKGFILMVDNTRKATGRHLMIVFSAVTSPSALDIQILHDTLIGYWRNDYGKKNQCRFIAKPNQRIFDCSYRFKVLPDDYTVMVNGTFINSGHSKIGRTVVFSGNIKKNQEVIVFI